MKKGSFPADTLERLSELGRKTAKESIKAVTDSIVGPFTRLPEYILGQVGRKAEEEKGPGKNYSPLKLEELRQGYHEQDLAAVRDRLFKLTNAGIRQAIEERKKEARERIENQVKDEKEEKEGQPKLRPVEKQIIPRGKKRRSIFEVPKRTKRPETRVGAGRQ